MGYISKPLVRKCRTWFI